MHIILHWHALSQRTFFYNLVLISAIRTEGQGCHSLTTLLSRSFISTESVAKFFPATFSVIVMILADSSTQENRIPF